MSISAEKIDEGLGLTRERTHVVRTDIEKMCRLIGRIGLANPNGISFLDEDDVIVRRAAFQKIDC